jgi:phosphatidylserine decarboxylase
MFIRSGPAEEIVQIKGRAYSLRTALHDENFNHSCLVIGIFMTFYDVHINLVPYAGRLNYRELDTIGVSLKVCCCCSPRPRL